MSESTALERFYVDGSWTEGSSDKPPLETLNPATGAVLARVAMASERDVDRAVKGAKRAFSQHWTNMGIVGRTKYLRKLADLLERDIEKIVQIEVADVGKPVSEARRGIRGLPEAIAYYAGLAPALRGETIPVTDPNIHNFTLREPLGPCALVLPWNSPFALMTQKVAPALAAGNTVVVKPSEITPLSTLYFARLFEEADFPPGVFNVINGLGGDVGHALVSHPLIARVSFTGGTETGRRIAASAALKPLTLELGGKSPLIVFDDADIEGAVAVAASDILRNAGQVCMACTRLLVHNRIRQEFVERLEVRLNSARIGAPHLETTEIGPVVSVAQKERIQRYVELGAKEGATPKQYGALPSAEHLSNGFFVRPTLFHTATNEMQVARDEIFGPVQAVIGFDEECEAIRLANDSSYGLAAIVFTRDGGQAHRVVRQLEAGNIAVNHVSRISHDAPFGGYKQSGVGRERGFDALLENTQVKNVKYMVANSEV